jgi:glycosyltransferase involved in cell wall biosynthesis
MRSLSAAIVITTKNRRDELAVALESCAAQTVAPQIVVIDDGSDDGTSDLVRSKYPAAKLDRVERSLGLIVQRNRGARLTDADIIISIDDDAALPSPHTVEQTLAEFEDPRVGAVAIPFVNVKQDDRVQQRAPEGPGVFVTAAYRGTAHALRRELFLSLGGYREALFHQGEEGDYCIRMLNAGYVVALGRADPIHHFESPRRDFRRMDLYGRRNDVLFAWHNVPWPHMPAHLVGTTINGIRFGFREGRPGRMIHGLMRGYAAIAPEWRQRRPVSTGAYRLFRMLRARGVVSLDEIAQELDQLRAEAARRSSASP